MARFLFLLAVSTTCIAAVSSDSIDTGCPCIDQASGDSAQDFFDSSRSLSSGSCKEDGEAADYFDDEEDEDISFEIDQAYVRKNGSSKRLQVVRLSGDYRGTFCSWYKDGMKVTLPPEHEACVKVLEDVCKGEDLSFEREYL